MTYDLGPKWSKVRVLRNPHKGWVHHYYDNDLSIYPPRDPAVLDAVPGLGLIYIRLPWSCFEPVEGQFDWHLIDEAVRTYAPRGCRFSFRITCKETGTEYATPEWVRLAGAKGAHVKNWGKRAWEPEWGDRVFLGKLDRFHAAFASRYDGKPWLEDVDTGSYGDWGEGHTGFSTNQPAPVAVVKEHWAIFARNYRKTPIVTGDDWCKWGRNPAEEKELFDEAMRLGFSIRDDSVLVHWWLEQRPATCSLDRPEMFEAVWRKRPTTLELQHYGLIKKDGDWKGTDGREKGADILRGAIELAHPTWVGYHGWADEWMRDNPGITAELANRIGYWFMPLRLVVPDGVAAGSEARVMITWQNRGVAPAYRRYALGLMLSGPGNYQQNLSESDCRRWPPDGTWEEHYTVRLPSGLPQGRYQLSVILTSDEGGDHRVVELGLDGGLRGPGGYYRLGELEVVSPRPGPGPAR